MKDSADLSRECNDSSRSLCSTDDAALRLASRLELQNRRQRGRSWRLVRQRQKTRARQEELDTLLRCVQSGPRQLVETRPDEKLAESAAGTSEGQSADGQVGGQIEHEESVDEYMTRLLQRVSPGSAEAKREPGTFSFSMPAGSPPAPASAEKTPAQDERRQGDGKAEHGLPRRAPPEVSTDIAAMQALANLSAGAAIHRHTRRLQLATAGSKAVVAVLAATVGLALLYLPADPQNVRRVAAVAAFCVAALWTPQMLALWARAVFARSAIAGPGTENQVAGGPECPDDHG